MNCPTCHADNPDTSRFCSSCAAALAPEAAPSLTKTLQTPAGPAASGALIAGKYRVLEEVGRGGMGIVYKAEDIRLQRPVALKFLPHQWVSDPDARERFVQEARAASALDHPNVCNIYEIGEVEDGRMYIAMAFYEGESLRERIKRGPLPVEEALGIALQAAAGMAKAHEKGIVHRDIKPANILITGEGVAKVVDFGLAKLAGQVKLTREGTTVGTVAYMSPEQAMGEAVDRRTDIWSLGVVLYEMLSGALPFKGDYEQTLIHSILQQEPERLAKFRKDLPAGLENVVFKALTKRPAGRYQTMEEMLKGLERVREGLSPSSTAVLNMRSLWRRLRRLYVAIPLALGLIVGAGMIVQALERRTKVNWARNDLLPKIIQLSESNREDYIEAYRLATEAARYIPHDPKLVEVLSKIAVVISINTDPPGAHVFMKDYAAPSSEWTSLGMSPIEKIRLPIGYFRWRMEKEGYETDLTASTTFDWDWQARTVFIPYHITRSLQRQGSLPPGMVKVTGAKVPNGGEVPDFFLDRCEVTNRQFKEFVTAGGYQERKYWKYPFVKEGNALAWEIAVRDFVDQTGRPGPLTWQGGDYPAGQADFPVSGVSWFEAAAYAEFAGKTLPTVLHWDIARGEYTPFLRTKSFFTMLAPVSNFSGHGPAPAGQYRGMTPYGNLDMAGNVREWCWNDTPGGRAVKGGAWNDTPYMFQNLSQASPFDRSPQNGFRCALYIDPEKIPGPAFSPSQPFELKDLYKLKPVPDAVFAAYKEQFAYDKTSLNANAEWRDESSEDWVQEKIAFDAAYPNERVAAYLFLPKRAKPPYQTVIYFPGSFSVYQRSSKDLGKFYEFVNFVSFIVKNGRAVFYPVYQGTFERGSDTYDLIHPGEDSRRYTDFFVQVVKDFMRSIDYLETRPDIDAGKLAYYGLSWGGIMGFVIPAVEGRLKASVLNVGGSYAWTRPEVNEINYVTRVKVPTLMLNGRDDLVFPYEACVKPMFDLLGTPKDKKDLRVYETDHFIPKNEVIKETLAWLDRYLGPVI